MKILLHNLKQLLIAIDQLLNTIIGTIFFYRSWADETLSSLCYRLHKSGKCSWPMFLVDKIFFWEKEHCKQSFESEKLGRQLPPEAR